MQPAPRPPPLLRSLSARLLALTVLFVMLAEVLIYAPSIGRFRKVWLEERLAAAHLASLALEATPDGMVDKELQGRLLAHAGTLGIELFRRDKPDLMLGPNMPLPADAVYDLRQGTFFGFIADAFETLAGDGRRVIKVVGPSPREDGAIVEALLVEGPLRREMLGYSQRILALSLFISGVTAALLFLTLHRMMIRPLRRLTDAMLAFREAPEDAGRVIAPGPRRDEIGTAERALAEMQHDLRAALVQKTRLAALGEAVTRIHHDLRGILASAMVVSERLEASGDPEVRRITPTILSAIDRAATLCTQTMHYAREAPPPARRLPVPLAALVDEVTATLGPAPTLWHNQVPAGIAASADRDLLFRVLANLLRNAAEAGAANLWITARREPAEIVLSLRDDGPGLPPRARDNLFRPFAGSGRPGGMGLGLAIARELAAAQGGRLSLRETGENGTTFDIRLPP